MVDIPKLKKGQKGEAPMPPPPSPGHDADLPAPAPPSKGSPDELPSVPVSGQGEKPQEPRKPEDKGGIEAVKPLKLPETKPKEQARGAEAAGHVKMPQTRVPDEAFDEMDIHGSPPVFIKVDKYGDIVKNLGRLKSFALSLRDALDALADIEKELTTGISIAHKALDDFNTTIAVLDSKLLRASSIKEEVSAPADVDRYVKSIYDQMERIKSELKSIGQ